MIKADEDDGDVWAGRKVIVSTWNACTFKPVCSIAIQVERFMYDRPGAVSCPRLKGDWIETLIRRGLPNLASNSY